MDTNEPTKFYPDFKSLKKANEIMGEFQVLRNILRHDYIALLKIAEQYKDKQIEFNAMYRACLVQLFTMIEADIYGLSTLDPYPSDNTKKNFYSIFTNTFKQIGITWSKEQIAEKYFNTHFDELMLIKNERNNLIHPKRIEDLLVPTSKDLEKLKNAFNNYSAFIGEITNGFYIGCQNATYEQLLELKTQSEKRGLILKKLTIKHIHSSANVQG